MTLNWNGVGTFRAKQSICVKVYWGLISFCELSDHFARPSAGGLEDHCRHNLCLFLAWLMSVHSCATCSHRSTCPTANLIIFMHVPPEDAEKCLFESAPFRVRGTNFCRKFPGVHAYQVCMHTRARTHRTCANLSGKCVCVCIVCIYVCAYVSPVQDLR